MNWQSYDLLFRLLSPLHVGYRKVGNLMQTRGYVPGKNVWAGLTARLTRAAGQGADGAAYSKIGEALQRHCRFTYLYPALLDGDGYKTCYPWHDDFDYRFFDSYTSAALNGDHQAAAEGLLHETEYIAPCTRDGQPVYLTGALYIQKDLPECLQNWQAALTQLQFGGERGYGWGRVQRLTLPEPVLVNEPVVTVAKDAVVRAHTYVQNAPLVGAIEPLIGWERNYHSTNRALWKLSDKAIICYAPGGQVTTASTFRIDPYGLWQAV
jgi:hypothetical protein